METVKQKSAIEIPCGISIALFYLADCVTIGTEGSIVSHWQVMKDQRSLLKGNPVG
jgi:hypothetical protein